MSSNAIDSAKSAVSSTGLTSDQSNLDASAYSEKLGTLTAELSAGTLKKQLRAVHELAVLGAEGENALVEFLHLRMDSQNPQQPTAAHGRAYQLIYGGSSAVAKAFLDEFPAGLVCPRSAKNIDYSELQMLLVQQDYQGADKLTSQKLCELAGESALQRKWVYFTEVEQLPALDLMAIDIIWGLYSEDKFGWSKQRALWSRLGKDWERLWPQLSWKTESAWTRYPAEFIWDLSAPVGHLPLSNQLRGVRTMSALLSHPVWTQGNFSDDA